MCQVCELWGIDLHAEQAGGGAVDFAAVDFAIAPPTDGAADFVVTGGRWTDNGSASGAITAALGASGGVVAWSIVDAGLANSTGQTFFTGSTVALGSVMPFDYRAVLQSAFDAWSAVGNIEFIQVQDNGGNIGVGTYPTIRISAGYIDGQSGSNVLARAFFPSSAAAGGDVVFDSGNTAFFSSASNFFLTAVHEIGHSLGLSHETTNLAIMNPYINTALSGLTADDQNGIRAVYGSQDFGSNVYYMPSSLTNLTILDGSPSLTVMGNALGNSIVGSGAAEIIDGGGGNDTLDGAGGADTLMGGPGNDTYMVGTTAVTVIESTGQGTDTVMSLVDYVLGSNVENLTLTGGSAVEGFGNSGDNTIVGNALANVLDGRAGADTLSGGSGDDVLLIDGQDVGIAGDAGFDSVFVQTGAAVTLNMGTASIEWAQGNAGADTFNAASQTRGVYIYGQGGDDTLTGSAFGDYLDGGDGTDTLMGGDGADTLLGNGGSDIMRGQGGDDYLIELGGDSAIDGGAGFDSLFVWSDTGVTLDLAAASIEWVQGSVIGGDTLNGAGNTVNSYLYGWGGADMLTGGSGDDYIAGGAGDDILTGGAGNDTLIGEGGTDRYVYTATIWGSDTIHSFDPNGETLDFTAVAAIHSFSDFATFEWDPGNLGYNSTTLFYSDGGTASAITLIGVQVASLSDVDFLFA
jgi:serralysin